MVDDARVADQEVQGKDPLLTDKSLPWQNLSGWLCLSFQARDSAPISSGTLLVRAEWARCIGRATPV